MKSRALLALLAVVPAPALSLIAALYLWPDTTLGQVVFSALKLWLLLLPVAWVVLVDRHRRR